MDSMSILRESALPFANFLGLRLLSATPDRIEAELEVRDELCTRPAVMHGGAMMAFADSLGGYAAMLNLPEGGGDDHARIEDEFLRRRAGRNQSSR